MFHESHKQRKGGVIERVVHNIYVTNYFPEEGSPEFRDGINKEGCDKLIS